MRVEFGGSTVELADVEWKREVETTGGPWKPSGTIVTDVSYHGRFQTMEKLDILKYPDSGKIVVPDEVCVKDVYVTSCQHMPFNQPEPVWEYEFIAASVTRGPSVDDEQETSFELDDDADLPESRESRAAYEITRNQFAETREDLVEYTDSGLPKRDMREVYDGRLPDGEPIPRRYRESPTDRELERLLD